MFIVQHAYLFRLPCSCNNLPPSTQHSSRQSRLQPKPSSQHPTAVISEGFTQNLPPNTQPRLHSKLPPNTYHSSHISQGFSQNLSSNRVHSTPSSQHPAQLPSVKALNHSNTFLPTPSTAALSQGFESLQHLPPNTQYSSPQSRLHSTPFSSSPPTAGLFKLFRDKVPFALCIIVFCFDRLQICSLCVGT